MAMFIGIFNTAVAQTAVVRDIVFPVDGQHSFSDDFGDPRSGGRTHEGIDIISAKLTPVVAAADGVISYLVNPEGSWGYAIYLEDNEGWQYRYLHINNDTPGTDDGNGGVEHAYAPGIVRGSHVIAGQLLGWVGDSGNAEYAGSHLHFEIRQPMDHVAVNPYQALIAARTPASVNQPLAKTVTTIIVHRNGVLVKYASSPKVYLLANQILYHIYDEYSFKTLGYNWSSIRLLPESELYQESLPLRLEPSFVAIYDDGTPVTPENAPAISNSYTFTKTLSLGSEGTEVMELQRILKSLGYYTYPTITGYFGTITRDAVLLFQKANNISPVGIVGPQSRAILNAL